MNVVKRNGDKEKFNKKKIADGIAKAGFPKLGEKISKIVVKELKAKEEVNTNEIREIVVRELQKEGEKTASQFASFKEGLRALSQNEEFLENRLKSLVGNSGELRSLYGGFEILIKETGFDYAGVFKELLNLNLSVTVEQRGEKIAIIAK